MTIINAFMQTYFHNLGVAGYATFLVIILLIVYTIWVTLKQQKIDKALRLEVDALDRQIAAAPENSELYLQRALVLYQLATCLRSLEDLEKAFLLGAPAEDLKSYFRLNFLSLPHKNPMMTPWKQCTLVAPELAAAYKHEDSDGYQPRFLSKISMRLSDERLLLLEKEKKV